MGGRDRYLFSHFHEVIVRKKKPGRKRGEDGIDTQYPFCGDGHRLRIGIVALLHRKVMPIIQWENVHGVSWVLLQLISLNSFH